MRWIKTIRTRKQAERNGQTTVSKETKQTKFLAAQFIYLLALTVLGKEERKHVIVHTMRAVCIVSK